MFREQRPFHLCWVLIICSLPAGAQILDTTAFTVPAIRFNIKQAAAKPITGEKKVSIRSFYLPAGLITYGIATLGSNGLREFNHKVREEVYLENPHKKLLVDDY